MKYVDYNNSQINAASDNKKNGRSSTSETLTQSANYPEAYKDEIMKTIRTVVNDETNDSISYIFITDMHIDTSEETREVAYNIVIFTTDFLDIGSTSALYCICPCLIHRFACLYISLYLFTCHRIHFHIRLFMEADNPSAMLFQNDQSNTGVYLMHLALQT